MNGPGVFFSWNRVPGDNGFNTIYRLYVQDQTRQTQALDVYTFSNSYAAYFQAEGSRYDVLVIANPGLAGAVQGPASGFNVRGATSAAPTPAQPTHQDAGVTSIGTKTQGNIQLAWTPVPGSTLYQYYVGIQAGAQAAGGVTPGLLVQVPLTAVGGAPTVYSAIMRACSPGLRCTQDVAAGWGPWSNDPGGPGVTNFTVVTGPGNPPGATVHPERRTSTRSRHTESERLADGIVLASTRLTSLRRDEAIVGDTADENPETGLAEPPSELFAMNTERPLPSAISRPASKRLATVTPAGGRRYSLYTPEMNLLAETDLTAGTPSIAYEYIWFNGQPVAQVDLPSTTHWTFTDHLGTPLLQTDSGGVTYWRAEYEPYGRIFSLRTTDQHQPLRLPGQEAEQLNLGANGATERSYNVSRWYRNAWGRYTQGDSIGVDGGLNLYAYAKDNPLIFADPDGKAVRMCCRFLGSGFGQAADLYHCYVQVNATDTWGLYPQTSSGDRIGTPRHNDTHDKGGECGPWTNSDDCISKFAKSYPPRHYANTGPNSNTYARCLSDRCRISPPHVANEIQAPGWNSQPWAPWCQRCELR